MKDIPLPRDWITTDAFKVGDIIRPNDEWIRKGFPVFSTGANQLSIVKVDNEFGYTRLWMSNGYFSFPKDVVKIVKPKTMDKINFNHSSTSYESLLGITPERKEQLSVLMKRATSQIEFDEVGNKRKAIKSSDYLVKFVELAQNPQEVVFLTFVATRKIADKDREGMGIPADLVSDLPSFLKKRFEEALAH